MQPRCNLLGASYLAVVPYAWQNATSETWVRQQGQVATVSGTEKPATPMSGVRATVAGNDLKAGATSMYTNYVHITTMTVPELWSYAVSLGVMPSELLDGRFWIRRVPSIHEDSGPGLRRS